MGVRGPDIYIIGTQKSGTTTLYDWLAQHPGIYAHPLAKDYPYFSNERTHREGAEIFYSFAQGAPDDLAVLGGDANAIFAPKGPQRMHQLMPNALLIVILRNPVQRAYSAYSYAVERLLEDRTLEQAIRDELGGFSYAPEDAQQRDYLGHGHYARQLKEVFSCFRPEQVKVVIFEELLRDPHGALRDLFHHLGVGVDFEVDMRIKNQTKGGYRAKWIASIVHTRPSSDFVRRVGRALIPFAVRTTIRRKLAEFNCVKRPKPEFDELSCTLLWDYYKAEITELEKLLERKFEIWKNEAPCGD